MSHEEPTPESAGEFLAGGDLGDIKEARDEDAETAIPQDALYEPTSLNTSFYATSGGFSTSSHRQPRLAYSVLERTEEMEANNQGHLHYLSKVPTSPAFTIRIKLKDKAPTRESPNELNFPSPQDYDPKLDVSSHARRTLNTTIDKMKRPNPFAVNTDGKGDPASLKIERLLSAPCVSIKNNPVRFPLRKVDEEPGPGHYLPKQPSQLEPGPKIRIKPTTVLRQGQRRRRGPVHDEDGDYFSDGDDSMINKRPRAPTYRLETQQGHRPQATIDELRQGRIVRSSAAVDPWNAMVHSVPGPSQYAPSYSGLSRCKSVLGGSGVFKLPTAKKTPMGPNGFIKEKPVLDVRFTDYSLFYRKAKANGDAWRAAGGGVAAMSRTA